MHSLLGGHCWCKYRKCSGTYRSKNTLRAHTNADFEAEKENRRLDDAIYDSPKLPSTCLFNPNLYVQHPAAQKELYKGSKLSQLDYIFVEFRKFVSHPTYSKRTVTENFRTDSKFKLPQPNNCPKDYR